MTATLRKIQIDKPGGYDVLKLVEAHALTGQGHDARASGKGCAACREQCCRRSGKGESFVHESGLS